MTDGRVVAVTTDNTILAGLIEASDGAFKLVENPFSDEPYGIGVKKDDDAFRTFINDELEKIFENGDWAKAFETTLGAIGLKTPEPPTVDRYTETPPAPSTTAAASSAAPTTANRGQRVVDVVLDNLDVFFAGLRTTVSLTLLSYAAALVIGIVVAACRVSPIPPLRVAGAFYVEIVRNTPLTVLFVLFFFGLTKVDIKYSAYMTAVIVLGGYTGAFVGETVRSGSTPSAAGRRRRPDRWA